MNPREPEIDPVAELARMLWTCGLQRVVDERTAITRAGQTFELEDIEPDVARYFASYPSLALAFEDEPPVEHDREIGDGRQTLKALGRRHGLSRERIRQIEMQALAKVRVELEAAGVTLDDVRRVLAAKDARA